VESDNGWIMPDGTYVECKNFYHSTCAEEVIGIPEKELEKIAIKITSNLIGTHFLTERVRPTKAQMKTVRNYCISFREIPPIWYFEELGFDKQEIIKIRFGLSVEEVIRFI
jgi:hypothetical protein